MEQRPDHRSRKVFDLGAEFDHLAHILMTENVSAFHGGLIAVEEMKIGTADRAGRDFNDCVARMLNFLGSGTVSTRTSPLPCQQSARIVSVFLPLWLVAREPTALELMRRAT